MKILFISTQVETLNSSASIRNSSLIKGLYALGHEVHVETIDYPTQYVSEYLRKNLCVERVGRTNLPIYRYNQSIKSKGLVKKNYFLRDILKKLRSVIYFPDISVSWLKFFDFGSVSHDYDLMISSSDSKVSHLIAEKIYKLLNIKWIQVWGDPWSDDFTLPKMLKRRAFKNERRLLSQADKIIYVSEATLEKQKHIFPKFSSKMQFVPRGFFAPVDTINEIREDRIHIAYTGNLFWGRNICNLVNAIREFNATSSKKCLLDIYGVQDEKFVEETQNDDFINTYSPVDYEQILKVYESSNVLLFISNSSVSTQIPGKFFDYSGTTRPILCLMDDTDTPIAGYLGSFDRCLIVRNEMHSIMDSMMTMTQMASRSYPIPEYFYPESVAKQILY